MSFVSALVVALVCSRMALEPAAQQPQPTLRIYGFAQADAIADFNQNNPTSFDMARPTTLPSSPKQFGEDGHFYLTPRQSRFGFQGKLPTSNGDVTSVLEFDMFGTGTNAGQTTLRLRHGYGQWKQLGAGQTNSQFMDGDVFPDILYYWSPNGMLLLRNPQVFWQPYAQGPSNLTLAIERPDAKVELGDVTTRFPLPDVTGHYRLGRKWGYVQVGGVLRYVAYDDNNPADAIDLSGQVWGGGVSISSNLKASPRDLLRLQTVIGRGVQTYVNDASIDVATKANAGNSARPFLGAPLPVVTVVAYLDHKWSGTWSTSAGYSSVHISNSDGQSPSAFKTGTYVSVNLLCRPATNVVGGPEFQWARRENKSDGFSFNDYRVEFSLKFSFDHRVGGS
ncbi:MAG TPA: DcaP family trimeric outer membrane transporter [Vicinamibacterales bacterium]|nr:DcaP family trimeric outer membrane transporter [Vicinamibacterales bacterium]